MRKTKIICTLGPSTDAEGVLENLIKSGMDVARINFSHQTHERHMVRADAVKKIRTELNVPVALLMDTKGPEIRTGTFTKKVKLEKGADFILTTVETNGSEEGCSISYPKLPKQVIPGCRILIDDGLIELRVKEVNEPEILCTVLNGGFLSSNKGINVPGIPLDLPFISDRDREDLKFAVEQDFDFVAASFTQSAQDLEDLRQLLDQYGGQKVGIIAKIENAEGVRNIEEILRVTDGIMIARGDLGVEIPMQDIPSIQKKLIKKAYFAGKYTITATQMLDSMMKNPRPTRAEVTDIANAIYDGTSAIMLSGETAAGDYPVESVQAMAAIATRTEQDIDYLKRFKNADFGAERQNVTSAISHATCTTAHDLNAVAIMTVSKSGKTARMISKFRPSCPIIAGTTEEKVRRQMNLSWGVIPIMVDEQDNTDALFQNVIDNALHGKLLSYGDLVVITAGIPLGISGTTNMLKVKLVGNVLVQGFGNKKGLLCGNLCVCRNAVEAKKHLKKGEILVISHTTNELMDQLKKCAAVITDQDGMDSHAAVVGMALDIPVIVGANNCTRILRDGTSVTMDSDRGIVYSGELDIETEAH